VKAAPSLEIYKAPEPVNGPVTLEEAMARALKCRLSSEINKITKTLETPSLNIDEYESLSHFAQMAGYEDFPSPWESKANAPSSLKISSVESQYGLSGEIASMWDILDMGMIYAANSWLPAKKNMVSDIIYKKAAFNIMQKTRYLYYKPASSGRIAGEVNVLLEKARSALKTSRKADGILHKKSELDKRKKLIEYTRFLWSLAQKLSQAKTELAVYINLPSGASFKLVTPPWDSPRLPGLRKSPDSLENLALINRAEPDLEGRIAKGGIYEIRGAILGLRPGLDFDSGLGTGSDTMTYDKSWWEAGLKVAARIYRLYSVPVARQSHKTRQAYNRQMALNMGVVSQLHLALQRYFLSLEEYNLSRMDYEVSEKLIVKDMVNKSDTRGKADEIGKAVESLIAKIRYHKAFAGLENAGVRIYNSIGVDPLPPEMETTKLSALTGSLIKARARWDSLLKEVQASYYPDAKNIPTIARKKTFSKAHKPAPGKIEEKDLKQPEKSKANPPKELGEKTDYPVTSQKSKNIQPQKTIVTNSDSAQKKGRKIAKEIEIFRDVVNIYFEPDFMSKVKGQGLIGEKYKLLGWSSKGWLKVEMTDGSFGWVPTKYVRPVEPTRHYAHEPVKDLYKPKKKAKPQKPIKNTAMIIITVKRSNVRSGPGLNYTVKYIEETGKRFTVRGRAGEWFKIRAKDSTDGWLHESVVKVIAGN